MPGDGTEGPGFDDEQAADRMNLSRFKFHSKLRKAGAAWVGRAGEGDGVTLRWTFGVTVSLRLTREAVVPSSDVSEQTESNVGRTWERGGLAARLRLDDAVEKKSSGGLHGGSGLRIHWHGA